MYCVVAWQRVIGTVFVLCGGVAACHRYDMCIVVVWQRFICMVFLLCVGLAACYGYVVCIVWWCGSVL